MKDIIFFLYAASYSTGIAAIFYAVFLYHIEKSGVLKKYIAVMANMMTVITLSIIAYYFFWDDNITVLGNILSFTIYLCSIAIVYLLPTFVNDFTQCQFARLSRNVFLFLAILSVAALITAFIFHFPYIHYIIMSMLSLAGLYSIFAVLYTFRSTYEEKLFNFMKPTAIVFLVMFPGFVVFDFFKIIILTQRLRNLPVIMPFFFMIWNLLFIRSSIRVPLHKDEPGFQISSSFIVKYQISSREKEITELLIKGNSYREIMYELKITMPTVKTHVSNIYKKTHTGSRIKLVQLIQQNP
ncbi:MAG: helix-turn-helix transcriptional regulator [Spirochaetales bacterium]|nr:helix-turn-helix transcriptional regulator [Spirochaetales bacterium]